MKLFIYVAILTPLLSLAVALECFECQWREVVLTEELTPNITKEDHDCLIGRSNKMRQSDIKNYAACGEVIFHYTKHGRTIKQFARVAYKQEDLAKHGLPRIGCRYNATFNVPRDFLRASHEKGEICLCDADLCNVADNEAKISSAMPAAAVGIGLLGALSLWALVRHSPLL